MTACWLWTCFVKGFFTIYFTNEYIVCCLTFWQDSILSHRIYHVQIDYNLEAVSCPICVLYFLKFWEKLLTASNCLLILYSITNNIAGKYIFNFIVWTMSMVSLKNKKVLIVSAFACWYFGEDQKLFPDHVHCGDKPIAHGVLKCQILYLVWETSKYNPCWVPRISIDIKLFVEALFCIHLPYFKVL